MASIDEIRQLIEQKLGEADLELVEMKFFRAGSRGILRVFIDKQGGVTIDDCEKASAEIAMLLDVEEFSSTPYTLEVSSPGLDRPLITAKDFRRVVGRKVAIRTKEEDGKHKAVGGILLTVSDEAVGIDDGERTVEIPLSRIHSGKVEVSFS